VTGLLRRWARGDVSAAGRVMPHLYDELHRIACGYFRGERSGHTLQATAVVNEALLRLLDQNRILWQSKAHFIGVAARIMRRLLVDHQRGRQCIKRGGTYERIPLNEAINCRIQPALDLVALDQALIELAELDAEKARIVELRFFGGLNMGEIAGLLEVSETTVERRWRRARAWLYGRLQES